MGPQAARGREEPTEPGTGAPPQTQLWTGARAPSEGPGLSPACAGSPSSLLRTPRGQQAMVQVLGSLPSTRENRT